MAFTGTNHDRELALLAASADQSAFEGLFERWFQALYDFVLHTVHDVDLAADVLRVTYSRAWDALRRGAAPYNVKSWLFGLAHDAAIEDIRHRSSLLDNGADTGQQAEDLDFARVDPNRLVNPEPILRDRELVRLVWQAVETLSPKDYMLLDLHLRQGLTPNELTEALSLRRNTVQPTLTRLREALEEAVTYTLLLSRGRRECPDLDALLTNAESGGQPSDTISLVEGHLGDCAACRERKFRYPSPVEVFAALASVPASPRLRQSVWTHISEYVQSSSAAPLVAPWWQERKVKIAGLAAAVVVLAAAIITPFASAARNAVHDPSQVHSTSHQIGKPSASRIVAVTWDPQPKAQAFAVRWSQQPRDLPDPNPDLDGNATGTISPPLQDGAWYFHLSTEGSGGHWTSTVHLGPFVIASDTPTPVPAPTDTPVPTAAAAAPASPSTAPTEAPTATPKPPATPTPKRSVTATPKPGATQTAAAATSATAKAAATAAEAATAKASAAAAVSAPASAPPPSAPPPSAPPPPPPTAAAAPPTVTPRPSCAVAFGNGVLAATTGSANRVALSWGSTGGCGPYEGSITAQYQDQSPYTSYPVSQPSGTLSDAAPPRCSGTYAVIYTLNLQDNAGQTTSASASTKVVWVC